jgi:hypothetical protein
MDRRFYLRKLEGPFRKISSQRGISQSKPLDRDWTDQIRRWGREREKSWPEQGQAWWFTIADGENLASAQESRPTAMGKQTECMGSKRRRWQTHHGGSQWHRADGDDTWLGMAVSIELQTMAMRCKQKRARKRGKRGSMNSQTRRKARRRLTVVVEAVNRWHELGGGGALHC